MGGHGDCCGGSSAGGRAGAGSYVGLCGVRCAGGTGSWYAGSDVGQCGVRCAGGPVMAGAWYAGSDDNIEAGQG